MIVVVDAQRGDARAIADLMEELDRFYGGTEFEPVDERERQITEMLFREHPAAYVILAKDSGWVVGMAAYSFLWPAVGLTQSLYLKELYVSEAARRKGVATLLMNRLIEIATESGCRRVEWTADADNQLALGFYRGMGYPENRGKVMFRLAEI
ncbi:N-acetyltransferase [Rhizocola hellebori]|uniref:N-acetyltransferase n=1 Tax=Rhizocola hellebori TaxID=1392758 RepID=A0A8J3QJG8_9ACTN|nr:GNAT family N-acetyltransferase [Rhizocola hellebori]GIH10266.1 N-acetyltransferase [Rhizocola hellebori]